MPKVVTDPVASQYEKWVYPLPVMDLAAAEEGRWRDSGDPYFLADAYWPDQHRQENLDILVAGCGANAAARYAYNHPKSRVLGIDLSNSSLAHEAYLKDKHRLTNLALHECRIEDVASLGREFDMIDASGVLHHLAEPAAGLNALRSVLRPDGVIFISLYGKYGRVGVYMYQELFRLLGLDQRAQNVKVIKQAVSALKQDHYLKAYVDSAPDLNFDAGWVDTFLHQQDRAFTVAECLRLVKSAGLTFQGWMENFYYHPDGQIAREHPFFQNISKLDGPRLWQAMELFHCKIAMHCFYACHPQRDPATYRVTFESSEFLDYVPVRRIAKVSVQENNAEKPLAISRPPFPSFELTAAQAVIFKLVDGKNTARECLEKSGIKATEPELVEFGRNFFRSLWRVGYLFMRRQP